MATSAMRTIFWLLLLFVAAVVAAAFLGRNDALVTVFWSPWRLDMSLNLFLITLLIACTVVYLALQALNALIGLPQRAREWRLAKRDRVAQGALRESLAMFMSGRYTRAHKAAKRAVTIQSETPELGADPEFTMLANLLAAGSMHRLQDRARRDEHLSAALAAAGGNGTRPAEEGARLMAAEWAYEDRDAERALELIGDLGPGVGRRTQALRLKLQAARLARRPVEALKTARLLAKHQAFSPEAAKGLLRSLAIAALESARDADQLRRTWQQLDASDRRDAFVAARAAVLMAGLEQAEEARAWLKPFWEAVTQRNSEELAALGPALVAARAGMGADWLPRLEAAVLAHPGDPHVAYALGRALAEIKLWGKARQQLERCADNERLPARMRRSAWLVLAELAEQDGDVQRASLCYRSAALVDG